MNIGRDQMMLDMRLSSEDLDGVDVNIKVLYDIYIDYVKYSNLMEKQAEYFAGILNSCNEVNSVKWRVKDPFSLINKIIRKKKKPADNPKYKNIDVSNYKEIITDLIGLRAIFIFKDHWSLVDEYIFKTLNICEDNDIIIYHAKDDNLTSFLASTLVKKQGGLIYNYKLEQKDSRYKSIHYTLKGERHTGCKIELQTRSILDEAWAEIDHHVRYPDNENEPELIRLMSILSGQISGCEEQASQSYDYYRTLEADKPENIAILDEAAVVSDLIEDSAKVKDDTQDTKNQIYIESFKNIDQLERISKIYKSTQPLRGFEDFDESKFFSKIINLNADTANKRFSKLIADSDPDTTAKRINKLLTPNVSADSVNKRFSKLIADSDSDTAAKRLNKLLTPNVNNKKNDD